MKELTLKDAFKRHTLDQDKILQPAETVETFRNRIKNLDIELLKETRRIDNGRLNIPVYFSVCGHNAAQITGTKKQMGKGATPAQAEASAVMELAERFSFFSFCKNDQNFISAPYADVKKNAISFEMICQSVHDTSSDLDISRKIFETLPLKWTSGYNLTRKQTVMVPFNWFFMINEFNGPSAGNCAEEAISQGVCEVVERHVSSIISQNKLNVPAIDPASANDKMVIEMLEKYHRIGIKLYISDFSQNMGIPTVGVMAYDPSTYPKTSEIVWTAGTTPDPQKALSRALTEVAQLAGDFNTNANYIASGLPKFSTLEQANFVTQPQQTVKISDLPDLSDNNIKVEVERLTDALAKKGMDVILIDTKHHQLDIPAFYTIVPGAHFRERAMGTSVGMFSAKLVFEEYTPENALVELKKMDQQLPGKYYLKFYIGSAYLALNAPQDALQYFEQALNLEPVEQDIPSIYSYMGVCLKDMGQYRHALDILEKGISYDTERTDIYNLMGFCYFMLKDHEAAINCFKKVIALDKSSAIDYANIGSNYRELGKKEQAIHYYQMALSLDPTIEFAIKSLEKLLKE